MKKIAKFLVVFLFVIGFATLCTSKVEAKESKDYVIKVNLGTNCVTIYKDNEPVKAMICSPSTETPVGTFYTPVKYRWHEMIGNCYAQYCTRITGSILFHSVWYYKNGDKSTMSVSAYNVMGNKASHGCVRLLCKDAKWIYDNCALKTKVVIFKGDKDDDPLGRPSFTPIKTGAFISWDPTDPDPKNPYQKVKPTITAKNIEIEYNSKIKPIDAVEIKDCLGNVLTKKTAKIKIKGKINAKKLGKYKVKYTVTDELGNKRVKTIKFKVVDTKKPKLYGAKKKKNIAVGETVDLRTGVTAEMVSGKNITSKITFKVVNTATGKKVKVNKGTVIFKKAGTYNVTYKITGTNKKKRSKTVKFIVVDKSVVPTMAATSVTLEYGSEFNALSYVKSIHTYKKGQLAVNANNVSVVGTVDTKKAGTYEVTYTFSDNGNEYTKVVVKLNVTVKAAPEETTTEVVTEKETATEEVTTEQTTNEEETSGESETSGEEETTADEEETTAEETTSEEVTTEEEAA